MYTYTKLKEAIQGTSKTLPKDWTPNAIKAIVISGQFIFVAYHVKQPKIIQLDTTEVVDDLKLNGSNGSLVNLLKQKQLSCLEEFYVDSLFQNYKGIMNLEEYIASLVNTRSRLRYYGYCQNLNPNELVQFFSKAQIDQLGSYSYAGDKNRTGTLQYETVQNPNWYTKYNLRPDKYITGDAPGGTLSRYFKRIEGQIEEQARAELTRITNEGIAGAIVQLYNQDVANLDNMHSFLALNKAVFKEKGTSSMVDSALKCISDVKVTLKPVKVSQNQLIGYLKGKSKPNKSLLDFYGKFFGIYSKEDTQLKLEDMVKRVQSLDGLSGFTSALYEGLTVLITKAMKEKGELYIMLAIVFSSLGVDVKNGDFLSALKEQRSHVGCAEVYINILMGICGYTMESLKHYMRRLSNG